MATSEQWDQKRVLVVWYCNTHVIPPFRLSERQVSVGVPEPGYANLPHLDAVLTKVGEYDLAEQLNAANIDKTFDLIVVASDASRRNCPINLDAFSCPKVLCVGDTQHLSKPLQFMLNYARKARFDAIASTSNRQHLHWFVEAGHDNCAWIPGLKVVHIPAPPTGDRDACVSFLGQVGKLHPFRLRLLQAIKSANIPLRVKQGARENGAALYSSSVLSFNASLNADLNMRIFEVMSASGCLITDRLTAYSGLGELFDEGREMLCYDGAEDLLETVKRYLAEPKLAFAIAEAGHRRFMAEYLARRQRDVLFNWVFRGELEPRYRALADRRTQLEPASKAFADRVELYEALQEFHRVNDRTHILVSSRITPRICLDAADLPRLQISQLIDESAPQQTEDGVCRVTNEQAGCRTWDFMLLAPGESVPAGVRATQLGSVAQALVNESGRV